MITKVVWERPATRFVVKENRLVSMPIKNGAQRLDHTRGRMPLQAPF